MKLIRTLVSIALATGFASASFAAGETTPALVTVPKNEAAIQENRAVSARDAANNPAQPAGHKTKSKQVKPAPHKTKATPASHKTKAKQGTATKKHTTKAPRGTHAAK